MRVLLTIFLLVICPSCAKGVSSQTTAIPSNPIISPAPEGWVLYPTPSADSPALRCANYSRREWRVTLDRGNVRTRLDTLRDNQAPLPAVIHSRSVAVGTKGYRSAQQVNDGWLVGLDVGEFGGGLWWFSSDGGNSRKLAEDNIAGFAKTSMGVLALSGLAHGSLDSGRILRIGDGAAGNRSVETLVDLGSAPRTFAVESPDSLLVLTTRTLVRVRASGTVEQLFPTNYGLLYPTSMALSPSGIIYVGMRHFITRLTPAGKGYREEWFVPIGCSQFRIRNYDCVCVPGRR